MEFPVHVVEAFNTHFSSTPNNDNLLHPEIHPTLTSVGLSSISFDIAGITTVMKYVELSHKSGTDGIPSVLFCADGLGLSMLLSNLLSLSTTCANIPSQWKTFVADPCRKSVLSVNLRDLSHQSNSNSI